MKIESERTVATLANAICLVTAVIKEVAGDTVADQLNGSPVTDETYATLISTEFNKDIVAARLPGA